MTEFEFIIPVQHDELLVSQIGQYHVEEVIPQRILTTKLQEGVQAYNRNGVEFIFEHFDTYYSLIIHGSKLEWVLINKGFEYVERACQQMCGHLEEVFQEKELASETREHNLNCLKMLLYLHTSLMKVKDSKLQAEMAASLAIFKRGRKAAATNEGDKEREWKEGERRSALDVIYNLLQLSLHRLWDPPLADDTFVDMVSQPCYRAIENLSIKNKTTRETVFQLLGILNKKYNHGISCTIKLVQIVQLYEHAVSPVCAGVAQLVTGWALTGLVARLVRELGEVLGGDGGGSCAVEGAAGEGAAQRHCAQLLGELTQLLPGHMIPAAQAMRLHLDNDECYPLRCSVLGMMCEILCRELKGEGLSDERKVMRDEFLDDLEEHLHDMSAYVRSKALQYWGRLQREGCVPITRQHRVLVRAIGRLQDRATLVRKNAVQLLKVFIEHNPFAGELDLKVRQEQLNIEKKILEELHHKLNPKSDPQQEKVWNEFKDELTEVIESKIDQPTQDDPPLSQGSVNDAYATIHKCLNERRYYDAFVVIRHAERAYPQAKLLRSQMDKKDQLAYFVALLRNVFVTPNSELSNEEDAEIIKSINEKEVLCGFLEESVSFIQLVQQAIPLVYTLLMSKQATDIFEAIDFFTTAHSFNIETAKIGIMGMLQLVWSPDQEKRDAVEKAYRQMYLSIEVSNERMRAAAVATRLVQLVRATNRGHAAALQALLARWLHAGEVGPPLIQVLWEMFAKKHGDANDEDSYAALSLLVMLAKAKPSIASANIEVIQNVGLEGSYKIRLLSTQMLLTLGQLQNRMPMESPLLNCLLEKLKDTFFTMNMFEALGTNSIDVIYVLCETPDLMCIKLLQDITERLESKYGSVEGDIASYPEEYLSRLVVLLGQIALQQLIYLDVTVYGELRRRNDIREQRKVAGNKNVGLPLSKGRLAELQTLNSSSASASSRRRAQNNSVVDMASTNTEVDDEEELEGAVANDADAELVRSVCETEVVGGIGDAQRSEECAGLLARTGPFLRALLATNASTPPRLRAAACLTLARFMLVSSTFCEDNMQLLMTMLKNSSCSGMSSNIVITLADLTLRFPNVIQPWTHYIYERLEDSCVQVRQCTVKMLSYLILHEMVRVRGQVATLARCCVDDDPSTRTMARLFFKQLSQKGNSLYNIIPDIISRLSDPELKLPEDHFRIILKYVMSLIQKDKQMEALVEKLCLRFKLSNNERQWRDLAFCLSLFNYNERSIKKLIENMDCYKDKLFSKEVYDCFKIIINNTNKMAKVDLKAVVSELSDKIEECFAVQESGAVPGVGDNPTSEDSADQPKKKTSNRRRRPRHSNSDNSDDSADEFEDHTPVKNKPKEDGNRASTRKRAPPVYSKKTNDSDESDEEDLDLTKRQTQKKELFKKPAGRVGRKRK